MLFFRLLLCVFAALPFSLFAFNGNVVTEGPLTVTIEPIPTVTGFDTPQTCRVVLKNSAGTPLAVSLAMTGLIDDCHPSGAARKQVDVAAGGQGSAEFAFTCGTKTYSALYPVHIDATFELGGAKRAVHAVQIVATQFAASASSSDPAQLTPVRVPDNGAVALVPITRNQISWSYIGGELVRLPIGWTGADATSAANFARGPITRGGVTRATVQLHPPYRPRAGTVFAEYRVQLPQARPIQLEFFNAIRDSTPREGVSDGVTFRVWANGRKLFERHTDSKVWAPGSADLSEYAGQTISLRLESHPGPRNNTTCDSSYWGDPVIAVGQPPKLASEAERTAFMTRARQALESGQATGDNAFVFRLESLSAAVVLGPNGLIDGAVALGDATRQVAFAGLRVAVMDAVLGTWPSAAKVEAVAVRRVSPTRIEVAHRLALNGRTTTLTTTLWSEGPALRMKVECPEYITALALDTADRRAERVFYGHGYCVEAPETFRAAAGGHNLATSHVGFEFEGGVALLVASDTPPDLLEVDSARRVYRLQTHPDATLTFVPGTHGAFDCAVRYRPLYDRTAAAGVASKAGRFVFDLWGGRYADDAALLARCFDYGLTHSLVLMHNWQRWGYDYRLPDVFPPNPSLGTIEDLQHLGQLCRERGVLWGLHDNYIDFYPDATGFTYDHVTFTPDGKPRRAWLNESRDAQSFQFRPDHIRPFLDRNLALIVPALHPTASFVDVFASSSTFDFFDRDGKLHSKRETQRAWGEAFAAIRNACGNNAPTVSEAGGDHLIGWLDGADAQVIQLGRTGERFHNAVACADWERVPWFDAVNHTRFSLHGVGYSDRYQGGRSREEHGIESDDYLTSEILMGHALMIDRGAGVRGAVRKYWLAQPFIESVAHDEVQTVAFADGDIHRQIVTWKSGARVCVNRGDADWTVDGHVLPSYGFHARNGAIECSVERINGAIVERSTAPGGFYVNARVFAPNAPAAISPRAERVEYLGGRKFRLVVNWDARAGTPRECAVFYHFSRPTPGRRAATEFVGGGVPAVPTIHWAGTVKTGENWTITIPDDMPLGDYEVLVGLHERRGGGERVRLQGDEDARRRYRVGKLTLVGTKATGVTDVRLEMPESTPPVSTRWLANTRAVDFGAVTTTGAFRCEIAKDHATITPLPDGETFEVRLGLAKVFGRPAEVASVRPVDKSGAEQGAVEYKVEGGEMTFTVGKDAFAYRIQVKQVQR